MKFLCSLLTAIMTFGSASPLLFAQVGENETASLEMQSAESLTEEEAQSQAEALEIFKSISGGLGKMPEPPKLEEKKLMIPVVDLKPRKKKSKV